MKGLLLVALLAVLVAVYVGWPPPQLSEQAQAWRNGGKYFNFKGHSIFYRDDRGSSKEGVLVVLHGFPTSSYDWSKMWPGLLEDYSRVIAPDFLGFGFSDKLVAHVYSIMEQADIVEALLSHHAIASVRLLAHDYGDTVAQELLHRFNNKEQSSSSPINIRSVCLSNGGMFPETNFPSFIQNVGAHSVAGPIVARLMCYLLFAKNLGSVFGPNTKPSGLEMEEFWSIFSYKSGYLVTSGLLQYIAERKTNRDRWVGALQNSTVPVYTIYGDEDIINPKPFIEYYRSIIPDPKLTVLEGIGHYPQCEAPDRMLQAYRDFYRTKPEGGH